MSHTLVEYTSALLTNVPLAAPFLGVSGRLISVHRQAWKDIPVLYSTGE